MSVSSHREVLLSDEARVAMERRLLSADPVERKRAHDALWLAHRPLAKKVAREQRRWGLDESELEAEAMLGIAKALRFFNPDLGVPFPAYAVRYARQAVADFCRRNGTQVRLSETKENAKLVSGLGVEQAKAMAEASSQGRTLSVSEMRARMAATFSVSEDEVVRAQHIRSGASADRSLNAPVGMDEGTATLGDTLASDAPNPEEALAAREETEKTAERINDVRFVLASMEPRQREVLVARHMQEVPTTLDELARRYNVSSERIRQIEAQAMKKLREMLTAA